MSVTKSLLRKPLYDKLQSITSIIQLYIYSPLSVWVGHIKNCFAAEQLVARRLTYGWRRWSSKVITFH